MNIPDHKRAKGRPKGSLNKRTLMFVQVLEARNFCPASAMIDCYQSAIKIYENYDTIYDAIVDRKLELGNKTPTEDKAHIYLKIAGDLAKEISSYAYPKLKATDTKRDPLEGLTEQEILEVLKNAQAALEHRIKEKEKANG